MNECSTCEYWNGVNPEVGECRRRAPVMRNIENDRGTPFWPYTSRTDGCGEWSHNINLNDKGNEDLDG